MALPEVKETGDNLYV